MLNSEQITKLWKKWRKLYGRGKTEGLELEITKNKLRLANLELQKQEIIDTIIYLEEEYEKAQSVIK